MKIDFNAELKTLSGEVIPENADIIAAAMRAKAENVPDVIPLTLKTAAVTALLTIYEQERNLSGEDKAKRFTLASDIHAGRDDIKAEDIVLVKKVIGMYYGPLIVGQAFSLLG